MTARSERCDQVRGLAAELALGIADGEQRARALEHLAVCADCRRELEELAAIADDLIDLAPDREPPPGFETRVLERLGLQSGAHPSPRRRHFFAGPRAALAAALVGAALATALMFAFAFKDDRELASQYRATLAEANGKYFQAAPLRTPGGERAGDAFAYEGSPAWVFFVLDGRYDDGLYRGRLITRSGRSIRLPSFGLAGGGWGGTLPVSLRELTSVRLTRAPDGPTLEADLKPGRGP